MRLVLRLSALAVILITVVLWFFGGMNRGFTQTSVQQKHIDPVTELDFYVTEDRFLPGVDFLAGGAAISLVLFGSSFLFRKK
jgi:hypothetical protein